VSRRILVTGGAGFIGQAVRRRLDEIGDRFWTFDTPNDVRNMPTVASWMGGVDGVIHLAGVLGTSETLNDESRSLKVNVGGALTVAVAAEQAGVPMVQIGTGHRGQLNVYAVTKACAEDLVMARVRWGELRANVVRAFHAYGPGQKPPPPYGKATVRKIIPSFICAALTGDPLLVNGTGRQTIDLVHVDDVARILVDALEPPYGRTLEAGTGRPVSVIEAARDVIRVCGSTSPIELVPMRAGEPGMSQVYATDPDPLARVWPSLDDTVDYYRALLA